MKNWQHAYVIISSYFDDNRISIDFLLSMFNVFKRSQILRDFYLREK